MPHEVDMDLLPWLVGTEAQVVERFLDLLATDVDRSSDPKSSMLADRLRALSEWAGRQQRRRLDLKPRLKIDEAVDQLVLAAEVGRWTAWPQPARWSTRPSTTWKHGRR